MEAALIMSTVLITLALVILSSLGMMRKVQDRAEALSGEGLRYEEGLRPSDIVRISLFIREWIPEK